MVRRYAQRTRVPVVSTRAEIERTLDRYGADSFFFGSERERAIVGFRLHGRFYRLDVPLTWTDGDGERIDAAEERRRWRVLLLTLKAKLEAAASGISTPEREFLANVMLPSGETFGDYAEPQLAEAYRDGRMPTRLLPAVASGRRS